jgi:hypothetical protein
MIPSYENTPPRPIFMVAAVGTDIALTHICTDAGRTSGGRWALWRDAQAEKGWFSCHGDDPYV